MNDHLAQLFIEAANLVAGHNIGCCGAVIHAAGLYGELGDGKFLDAHLRVKFMPPHKQGYWWATPNPDSDGDKAVEARTARIIALCWLSLEMQYGDEK